MITAAMCVAMLVPSVCSESGGITVNSSELAQEKAWSQLSNVQPTVNANELVQEKVWTKLAGSIQITVNACQLAQEPVEENDNNSQTEQA